MSASTSSDASNAPIQTIPNSACTNPDCKVKDQIHLLPPRKTTQFVLNPRIVHQPSYSSGNTTIFEVEGVAAKMGNIVDSNKQPLPHEVYRIMPNCHAHIINYVIVDGDGSDSKRKIMEKEVATMERLIEAQRGSAKQMLQKLINGTAGISVPTPTVAKGSPKSSTPINNQTRSQTAKGTVENPVASPIKPTVRGSPRGGRGGRTRKTLPSASTSAVLNTPTESIVPAEKLPVPLITPVPLANLQNNPNTVSGGVVYTAPPQQAQRNSEDAMTKMQEELAFLRATVAALQMSQSDSPQPVMDESRESTPALTPAPTPASTLPRSQPGRRAVKRALQK